MKEILNRLRRRSAERPPTVAVVGDLMLDRYLWGRCDRVSPEAPVQVVEVGEETRALGGAGNVAANLRCLGADVRLAAVLGADAGRDVLATMLGAIDVSADGLIAEAGRATTEKTRIIATHQQVVRFDVETRQPITAETEAAIVAHVGQGRVDAIVMSDYGKGVLTPSLTQALIALGRERGIPVLVDPKGVDWTKYEGATMLTPNRKEAALVAGRSLDAEDDLQAAGAKLRERLGLRELLITLSEKGMAVFDDAACHRIPTVAREVYDVTGAGDTVIAAVAFALALGESALDACRVANAAAGVAVSKVGASAVSFEEIAGTTEQDVLSSEKVRSRADLARVVEGLHGADQRVVFTNGCFDILHVGHIHVLEQARTLGDVLVVGLNTDASVGRLKPGRPFTAEEERARVLAALSSVDYVVLFDEDTPLELITALQPDVLVKGGDYAVDDIVGADVVRARGGEVRTIPLVEGRSTTNVVTRIREEMARS